MSPIFPAIKRGSLKTLQINIGYKCNQTCKHCHVNAGPNRKEMMGDTTLSYIPKVLKLYNIKTLDITGGAPELHPKFKDLVVKARSLGIEVIDRCNLTILSEPGQEDTAQFLAENNVQIVASLPCYIESNVDQQRGKGVFERSISALKLLNSFGYGLEDTNLSLNLVYNPQGPQLPPSQKNLEISYKEELYRKFGVKFTNLLALANMPINRFNSYLKATGKLNYYQKLLEANHNPNNLDSVMCKTTLSVDWQGDLYDCDFNQQLRMRNNTSPYNLSDLIKNTIDLNGKYISVGSHCFGCTAGAGSSCGGSFE